MSAITPDKIATAIICLISALLASLFVHFVSVVVHLALALLPASASEPFRSASGDRSIRQTSGPIETPPPAKVDLTVLSSENNDEDTERGLDDKQQLAPTTKLRRAIAHIDRLKTDINSVTLWLEKNSTHSAAAEQRQLMRGYKGALRAEQVKLEDLIIEAAKTGDPAVISRSADPQ